MPLWKSLKYFLFVTFCSWLFSHPILTKKKNRCKMFPHAPVSYACLVHLKVWWIRETYISFIPFIFLMEVTVTAGREGQHRHLYPKLQISATLMGWFWSQHTAPIIEERLPHFLTTHKILISRSNHWPWTLFHQASVELKCQQISKTHQLIMTDCWKCENAQETVHFFEYLCPCHLNVTLNVSGEKERQY